MQLSHARLIPAALMCLAASSLTGCVTGVATTPDAVVVSDQISISGELAYRQRISLPPGSRAQVSLSDTSLTDRNASIVATTTIDLGHRQVPVPFQLTVATDRLQSGHSYGLRAGISDSQGQLLWTTDTVHPVDTTRNLHDAGTLWLTQVPEMVPVSVSLPYTARGQEPGWILRLAASSIALDWNYGNHKASMPLPNPVPIGDAIRYSASDASHRLSATIRHALCRDSMSDMPYPDQVTIDIDGAQLQGCGGDPGALLAGTQWVVDRIDGRDIVDPSQVTLQFSPPARVSGRAGCNSYSGDYELTGESLRIHHLAMTLMACDPALDQQEQRFIAVLNGARSFDISEHGTLVIRAESGATLEAGRETTQP